MNNDALSRYPPRYEMQCFQISLHIPRKDCNEKNLTSSKTTVSKSGCHSAETAFAEHTQLHRTDTAYCNIPPRQGHGTA